MKRPPGIPAPTLTQQKALAGPGKKNQSVSCTEGNHTDNKAQTHLAPEQMDPTLHTNGRRAMSILSEPGKPELNGVIPLRYEENNKQQPKLAVLILYPAKIAFKNSSEVWNPEYRKNSYNLIQPKINPIKKWAMDLNRYFFRLYTNGQQAQKRC